MRCFSHLYSLALPCPALKWHIFPSTPGSPQWEESKDHDLVTRCAQCPRFFQQTELKSTLYTYIHVFTDTRAHPKDTAHVCTDECKLTQTRILEIVSPHQHLQSQSPPQGALLPFIAYSWMSLFHSENLVPNSINTFAQYYQVCRTTFKLLHAQHYKNNLLTRAQGYLLCFQPNLVQGRGCAVQYCVHNLPVFALSPSPPWVWLWYFLEI